MALLTGQHFVAKQKDEVGDMERRESTQASIRQSQKNLKCPRVLVSCAEVEALVFGDPGSPTDKSYRKKDRTSLTDPDIDERGFADAENTTTSAKSTVQDEVPTGAVGKDADDPMARSLRTIEQPAQNATYLDERKNGKGNTAETQTPAVNQQAGLQKAHRREMVRCAARRGVAFGFMVKSSAEGELESRKRKCEAIMQGKVVEPSFAKGDWSVRWREREG